MLFLIIITIFLVIIVIIGFFCFLVHDVISLKITKYDILLIVITKIYI